MSYDTEWLSEAATVGEVCQHLELLLNGFRANGSLDRLPTELRSISARTPEEVLEWCELLDRNSSIPSRVEPYASLFDAARARITHLTRERPERRIRYTVYVSKAEEPKTTAGSRRFSTIDDAANACILLIQAGYKVLRVRLPSGSYVTGSQIEWAIKMGVSSVKIALTR